MELNQAARLKLSWDGDILVTEKSMLNVKVGKNQWNSLPYNQGWDIEDIPLTDSECHVEIKDGKGNPVAQGIYTVKPGRSYEITITGSTLYPRGLGLNIQEIVDADKVLRELRTMQPQAMASGAGTAVLTPPYVHQAFPGEDKGFLNGIFSVEGRMGRINYLLISITACIVGIAGAFLFSFGYDNQSFFAGTGGCILYVLGFWIGLAAAVKRCHDIGLKGEWILLNYLPIFISAILILIGGKEAIESDGALVFKILAIILVICGFISLLASFIFSLILLFKKGQKGYNGYGA